MAADEYISQAQAPQGPGQFVGGMTAPTFDTSTLGDSVSKFGETALELKQKLEAAKAHTQVALATTDYLTKLDALEKQYTEDPNFKTAPGEFAGKRLELESQALATIPDDQLRERAQVEFRRAGITSFKRVNQVAFGREADANAGAIDAQELPNLRAVTNAGSVVERNAATARQFEAIDAAERSGWISAVQAGDRKKRFLGAIDSNDAIQLIRTNPAAASAALDDPKNFTNMDPLARQQMLNAAKSQSDTSAQVRLTNLAAFNPAAASATAGTLGSPTQGRAIFDTGILPTENAKGDNTLISSAGAVGMTQIMPATARDMAKKLGLADIAALDDKGLAAKLSENTPEGRALNYRLGLEYWNTLAVRYNGQVPVMMAAYNGGPTRADAWLQKANEQFGFGFTPAQFQSVVDIPETKNYIAKAYKAVGADMNGLGMSPDGMLKSGHAVGAAIDQQASQANRIVKDEARAVRAAYDPLPVLLAGNTPDPQETSLWLGKNQQAAAQGDLEAQKAVSEYQFRLSLRPFIKQAYASSPASLDQLVAQEEQRQTSGPVTSLDQARLSTLKAVRDEVKGRATSDPVTLFTRAGLAPVVAVDPAANPADPAFRQALASRGSQALAAQRLYLGSANPFMPAETNALKERWSNAGLDEKFQLLQSFGATLQGDAYHDAVKAVTGSDKQVFVGMLAAQRPELARDVMRGQELLKSKDVTEKAALVRPAFSSKLGGLVYPQPEMQKAVEDAALSLYVSRAGNNGTLYDTADTGGIEKAITDITGPIIKRNGVKVPIAPNINAARFVGALDNLTEADVQASGGAVGRNGQPISAADIGRYAILKPQAPGSTRYIVGMRDADARDGFAPIRTYSEGGDALVFDMAALAQRHPSTGWQSAVGLSGTGRQRAGEMRRQAGERIRGDYQDETP